MKLGGQHLPSKRLEFFLFFGSLISLCRHRTWVIVLRDFSNSVCALCVCVGGGGAAGGTCVCVCVGGGGMCVHALGLVDVCALA